MISASTDRFRTDLPLADRLAELAALGLTRFEVSLPGNAEPPSLSAEFVKRNGWAVVSVTTLGRACPGLADPDPERRQRAVEHALAAARWARRRRTPLVVVDPGLLAVFDVSRREEEAWRAVAKGPPAAAAAILEPLLAARRGVVESQIEALCRSLHFLESREPEIRWCLPTPAGPSGFPAVAELRWVFDELGPRRIGYWHRASWAERNRRMGGDDPEAWLDAFGANLAGADMDDLAGEETRLLPGTGETNLRAVAEALPREAVRVLPVPADAGTVVIQAALRYLASIGID